MKFIKQEAFWHTVNKWIRDGSFMFAVTSIEEGTFVDLMGKDGVKEELIFYYTQEAYDADTNSMPAAE